jgi:ribosomal protein S18 acetylase RimI-like enzyme
MNIRPATAADVPAIAEIDSVIESTHYHHVEQSTGEAGAGWRLERRPLRERLIEAHGISDDLNFTLRQIASGADEGLCLVAEHNDALVAALLARPREGGTLELLDLRVDCAHRREGLATVLLFQMIEYAKNSEYRAASAFTLTNNEPAFQMLQKLGWQLSGIDTRRDTNHDLVKERASLIWYYETNV